MTRAACAGITALITGNTLVSVSEHATSDFVVAEGLHLHVGVPRSRAGSAAFPKAIGPFKGMLANTDGTVNGVGPDRQLSVEHSTGNPVYLLLAKPIRGRGWEGGRRTIVGLRQYFASSSDFTTYFMLSRRISRIDELPWRCGRWSMDLPSILTSSRLTPPCMHISRTSSH